jgi:hypothetical protein
MKRLLILATILGMPEILALCHQWPEPAFASTAVAQNLPGTLTPSIAPRSWEECGLDAWTSRTTIH